ncbi:MAG TPA: response regulator [Pyrinomonadaceae bacterium]|nr:response regulator [Pyrinomonadaceae bacterium]
MTTNPEVLRAIERDLRRQYASNYRVLRAESGTAALEIVKELKLRNNTIALFLVDQRMPGLSGVEFLEQAIELFPDAKRALLTAYADTDAAIAAINEAGVNHFLLKPWEPPEENLYPVIDDLLEDWIATFPPQFEGIRVLGNAGRRIRTTSKIFSLAITSLTSGSTSRLRKQILTFAGWLTCSMTKIRKSCHS